MNRKLITRMMGWLGTVKVLHWQAPRATNAHETLGELYDGMEGLLDRFAESVFAKTGDSTVPADSLVLEPGTGYADLLRTGTALVSEMRRDARSWEQQAGDNDDLVNLLADMSQEITDATYWLEVKVRSGGEDEESEI